MQPLKIIILHQPEIDDPLNDSSAAAVGDQQGDPAGVLITYELRWQRKWSADPFDAPGRAGIHEIED